MTNTKKKKLIKAYVHKKPQPKNNLLKQIDDVEEETEEEDDLTKKSIDDGGEEEDEAWQPDFEMNKIILCYFMNCYITI